MPPARPLPVLVRGRQQGLEAGAVPPKMALMFAAGETSTAGALSRRLARLGAASGVLYAALHRLRHGVATYLVDQELPLKAQARLRNLLNALGTGVKRNGRRGRSELLHGTGPQLTELPRNLPTHAASRDETAFSPISKRHKGFPR
jgi:hypothetical protein